MTGFSNLYSWLTLFMAICAGIYAGEYLAGDKKKKRFFLCMILTCAATLAVFRATDLLTFFLFFEWMALASYLLVLHEETEEALAAGRLYLAVAVAGGMALLLGMMVLEKELGTLVWTRWLPEAVAAGNRRALYAGGGLAAAGFAAKAGLFPIHSWLPKAHGVAPAPASALLSGMLTKTGIYGLLLLSLFLFRGDEAFGLLLLSLALLTLIAGSLLALLATNLKKLLACSTIAQMGFLALGLALVALPGPQTESAAKGLVLHMVNHSLVKLLLFFWAGAVYLGSGELDLDRLRGFGRGKPGLLAAFALGATSLGGLPLTAGFRSKTLLHYAWQLYAGAEGGPLSPLAAAGVEVLFVLAGACTLAYCFKLFVILFLVQDPGEGRILDPPGEEGLPLPIRASLALPGALLLALGLLPGAAEALLARAAAWPGLQTTASSFRYYSLGHLQDAALSLALGLLIYFLLVRREEKIRRRFCSLSLPPWERTRRRIRGLRSLWPTFQCSRPQLPDCDLSALKETGLQLAGSLCQRVAAVRPKGPTDGLMDKALRLLGDAGLALQRAAAALLASLWQLLLLTGLLADRALDAMVGGMERNLFHEIRSDDERFSPLEWARGQPFLEQAKGLQELLAGYSHSFSFGLLATVVALCIMLIYLL